MLLATLVDVELDYEDHGEVAPRRLRRDQQPGRGERIGWPP